MTMAIQYIDRKTKARSKKELLRQLSVKRNLNALLEESVSV